MPLTDYITVGGVEVVNHTRLNTYLQTVGSPLDSTAVCSCESLTAEMVGDLPYSTPEEDEAPWYDPDVPESAQFAGFLLLNVEGLDENPVRRTVTNGVAGGGAIGPARALPRTMVFTGILLGATCCAVEYGLHWLGEALQGCTGGQCEGDCMTLFNCCPGAETSPDEFAEKHRRTIRRVALIDGPRVISRTGNGCVGGDCESGADIVGVEFTLTAGTPWLWTDPMTVMEIVPPVDPDGGCVTWCLHPSGGEGCDGTCRFAPCPDPTAACADDRCLPPAPPVPLPPDTCFCLPLAAETDYYEMDLTSRPSWSVDAPVITVTAGSTALRNITIEIFERSPNDSAMTCEEVAAVPVQPALHLPRHLRPGRGSGHPGRADRAGLRRVRRHLRIVERRVRPRRRAGVLENPRMRLVLPGRLLLTCPTRRARKRSSRSTSPAGGTDGHRRVRHPHSRHRRPHGRPDQPGDDPDRGGMAAAPR